MREGPGSLRYGPVRVAMVDPTPFYDPVLGC